MKSGSEMFRVICGFAKKHPALTGATIGAMVGVLAAAVFQESPARGVNYISLYVSDKINEFNGMRAFGQTANLKELFQLTLENSKPIIASSSIAGGIVGKLLKGKNEIEDYEKGTPSP